MNLMLMKIQHRMTLFSQLKRSLSPIILSLEMLSKLLLVVCDLPEFKAWDANLLCFHSTNTSLGCSFVKFSNTWLCVSFYGALLVNTSISTSPSSPSKTLLCCDASITISSWFVLSCLSFQSSCSLSYSHWCWFLVTITIQIIKIVTVT